MFQKKNKKNRQELLLKKKLKLLILFLLKQKETIWHNSPQHYQVTMNLIYRVLLILISWKHNFYKRKLH